LASRDWDLPLRKIGHIHRTSRRVDPFCSSVFLSITATNRKYGNPHVRNVVQQHPGGNRVDAVDAWGNRPADQGNGSVVNDFRGVDVIEIRVVRNRNCPAASPVCEKPAPQPERIAFRPVDDVEAGLVDDRIEDAAQGLGNPELSEACGGWGCEILDIPILIGIDDALEIRLRNALKTASSEKVGSQERTHAMNVANALQQFRSNLLPTKFEKEEDAVEFALSAPPGTKFTVFDEAQKAWIIKSIPADRFEEFREAFEKKSKP